MRNISKVILIYDNGIEQQFDKVFQWTASSRLTIVGNGTAIYEGTSIHIEAGESQIIIKLTPPRPGWCGPA